MSRRLVQTGPLEAVNDSTLIYVVCQYAIHVHYTNGSQGDLRSVRTFKSLPLAIFFNCGCRGSRSPDPRLNRPLLYQLSYTPILFQRTVL